MTTHGRVLIGSEGADHVLITPSDSVHADVEVRCDGWSGRTRTYFGKGELGHFAQEILRLHRDLVGTAELNPLEPNIVLTLSGDGKGHIAVDGTARNDFASGTKLTFRFIIDQTFLEGIAQALAHADSSFL